MYLDFNCCWNLCSTYVPTALPSVMPYSSLFFIFDSVMQNSFASARNFSIVSFGFIFIYLYYNVLSISIYKLGHCKVTKNLVILCVYLMLSFQLFYYATKYSIHACQFLFQNALSSKSLASSFFLSMIWAYTCVVEMDLCPSNLLTVYKSVPSVSPIVAKEWRAV